MSRTVFGSWLLLSLFLVPAITRAGEPACECECDVPPILSKIPYLNRLFKNVAIAEPAACEELPPPRSAHSTSPGARLVIHDLTEQHRDQPERIGVDFDFNIEEIEETKPIRQTKRERAEERLQQAEEEKRELMNALVELHVENAMLKAKLEFAEERAQLLAEIERLKSEQRLTKRESQPTRQVAAHGEIVDAEVLDCRSETATSDTELARRIMESLQQNKQAEVIRGFQIDMQVDRGTVKLTGNVASQEQQERILSIVERAAKVNNIINELKIKPRE
jgi:hypothetical protein